MLTALKLSFIISIELRVIYYWGFTQIIYDLLLTIHCSLLTIHCSLLTPAHYSLLTNHWLFAHYRLSYRFPSQWRYSLFTHYPLTIHSLSTHCSHLSWVENSSEKHKIHQNLSSSQYSLFTHYSLLYSLFTIRSLSLTIRSRFAHDSLTIHTGDEPAAFN